jgi:hypothetical protein
LAVTLQFQELNSVVESLLDDFEGRVPFETLCRTIHACTAAHPRASAAAVERIARLRLMHAVPYSVPHAREPHL